MEPVRPTKRPFGLTLAGLWTGSYAAILSAFFGLALIGSVVPSDIAVDPPPNLSLIIINLVASLCGVAIGLAILRRWRWGYWAAMIFHIFNVGNMLSNTVQYAPTQPAPLNTAFLTFGVGVSVISLLILIYLVFGRKRSQFVAQI